MKHRIIQVVMGDGSTRFFPQKKYKYCPFWLYFKEYEGIIGYVVWFGKLAKAKEYIAKRTQIKSKIINI